jgi:hypothetical protein
MNWCYNEYFSISLSIFKDSITPIEIDIDLNAHKVLDIAHSFLINLQ